MARIRKLKRDAETLRRNWARSLVQHYLADPEHIAQLCDEVFDQSGALLGYVREAAKGRECWICWSCAEPLCVDFHEPDWYLCRGCGHHVCQTCTETQGHAGSDDEHGRALEPHPESDTAKREAATIEHGEATAQDEQDAAR